MKEKKMKKDKKGWKDIERGRRDKEDNVGEVKSSTLPNTYLQSFSTQPFQPFFFLNIKHVVGWYVVACNLCW